MSFEGSGNKEEDSARDAFGRFRVANPITLFDCKNLYDDPGLTSSEENQPLFFDNIQETGSGTTTSYVVAESSQKLTVSMNTAGKRVRQTKMRFNYQPGKSHLMLMSFNLNGAQAGITKGEGYFDDSNGIFLQSEGTTVSFIRRTSTSGSPVDETIAQTEWSVDKFNGKGPSGVTIDWTKTQILFIDLEWLGVGRVRCGFNVDGKYYTAHEFLNTNTLSVPYITIPNLPIRSEIENDGTGVTASVTQICSTVISEGGSNDLGVTRYASTNGAHVDMASENTVYAILGMQLKSAYLGVTVKVLNAAVQLQTGTDQIEWMLLRNPTVASTFSYVDETNSAVQIARGTASNTVTGGIPIIGGFLESGGAQNGNAGSGASSIDNALYLGSLIDGTVETLVLCARPIGGTSNADVEGSLTWREVL